MELTAQQRELAAQCLQEMQQINSDIEGIIFASIGGFLLSSTLKESGSTDRLTAVTTVLHLLSQQVSQAWRADKLETIFVTMKDCYLRIFPAGAQAVLIFIQKRTNKLGADFFWWQYVPRACRFLAALVEGEQNLLQLNAKQKERATRRLRELQKRFSHVEGILLATIGGAELTSTFDDNDDMMVQRLLDQRGAVAWRGEATVAMYVTRDFGYVMVAPVADHATLTIILKDGGTPDVHRQLVNEVKRLSADLELLMANL